MTILSVFLLVFLAVFSYLVGFQRGWAKERQWWVASVARSNEWNQLAAEERRDAACWNATLGVVMCDPCIEACCDALGKAQL